MVVTITKCEATLCRSVAAVLRKDVIRNEIDDNSATSRIVRVGEADPTPTVLFRTIVSSAGVFGFAGIACVLMLYSLLSNRWIEVTESTDGIELRSQGLRYTCEGSNCKAMDFASMSECRSESAVASRFRSSMALLSICFAMFLVSAVLGAFLSKRFGDLCRILKTLRYEPDHFLKVVPVHSEHALLFRNQLYADVAIDENGLQKNSPGVKRNNASNTDDIEMITKEEKVFVDLWASDSDDNRSKSGSMQRSPAAQQRRSLKRKELKLRLAHKKVEAVHFDAQWTVRHVLIQLFTSWMGWIFAVAGTALFHDTSNSWLFCGKSVCDVATDGTCAYGPGFGTAITGTLMASVCALFSVLTAVFSLADAYACLSATTEIELMHDAQIKIVQQASVTVITGQSENPPVVASDLL